MDIGRAKSIEVLSQRDRTEDPHRIKLVIRAIQADGRSVAFDTFLEVV
jgi:hypothetical protein